MPTDETYASAAEFVVGAMSDGTRADLLERIISQMIFDCGDSSTLEQFEATTRAIVPPFGFKLDEDLARGIVAAAAAAHNLLAGAGNNDEGIVSLAQATLNKEEWIGRI